MKIHLKSVFCFYALLVLLTMLIGISPTSSAQAEPLASSFYTNGTLSGQV